MTGETVDNFILNEAYRLIHSYSSDPTNVLSVCSKDFSLFLTGRDLEINCNGCNKSHKIELTDEQFLKFKEGFR